MVICPECGKEYAEGKFCPECGCKLEEKIVGFQISEKKDGISDCERVADFYKTFFDSNLYRELLANREALEKALAAHTNHDYLIAFLLMLFSTSVYTTLLSLTIHWSYRIMASVPVSLILLCICQSRTKKYETTKRESYAAERDVQRRYEAAYQAYPNPPVSFDEMSPEYVSALLTKLQNGMASTLKEAKKLVDEDKKHRQLISSLSALNSKMAQANSIAQKQVDAIKENTRSVDSLNRTVHWK